MDYIFEDIEVCECIGYFEDEYVYDIEMMFEQLLNFIRYKKAIKYGRLLNNYSK